MEERLESLYALLSSANQAKGKEIIAPPPPQQVTTVAQPEAQAPDFHEFFTTYTSPHILTETPKFSQQYPIWSFPHFVFDDIQDVVSKCIIGFEQAEESLRFFQTKACHFPFVVVSPQTSLNSLRREKPFLLLSILTFSAQDNCKLQSTLELEIREQLSRKVIVNGEKSMDLLQGILIYLCWWVLKLNCCSNCIDRGPRYQYYFKPERQQVYQLSQMAAAMAVDLGINQPTQNASQTNNFTILNVTPQIFQPRQTPEEIEAKRTFAGCYYLSSA